MIDLILFIVVMTAFACFFLALYSHIFREYIRMNLFNGISKETAREYIKSLPFRQRLFITYIKKCNPTGKQRLGLAIWLITCHFIHIIAVIALIVAIWYEFLHELVFNQAIDATAYIIGLPLAYNYFLSAILIITMGALPFSAPIGLLIHRFSKNKYDLQTVRVTRGANPSGVKSKVHHVFTNTLHSAPCKIEENETKEFKVVKARQEFWTSQAWIPQQVKRSNTLDLHVNDCLVELEVGCDENNNLWIREKEK